MLRYYVSLIIYIALLYYCLINNLLDVLQEVLVDIFNTFPVLPDLTQQLVPPLPVELHDGEEDADEVLVVREEDGEQRAG